MANETISRIQFGDVTYDIRAVDLYSGTTAAGAIPKSNGTGGITWEGLNGVVSSLGGVDGDIGLAGMLEISSGSTRTLSCSGFTYADTEPEAEYTGGGMKVAIFKPASAASVTYRVGWLYYILE